jgi:hypothetical protein
MKKLLICIITHATVSSSSVASASLAAYVTPSSESLFSDWLGKLEVSNPDLRAEIKEENIERSIEVLSSFLIPHITSRLSPVKEPLRSALRRAMMSLEVVSQLGMLVPIGESLNNFYVTRFFNRGSGVVVSYFSETNLSMTLRMVLPRCRPAWESLKIIARDSSLDIRVLTDKVVRLAIKEQPDWYTKLFSALLAD